MSVDTDQAAASGSRAVSKMQSYHKSCLRQRQRRLSDTTLGGGGGGLPKNDSMDDCSSYSYSSSMSDDGGGAESGSSSSRFSSCDGLLSRKSVSFADSVGEDLCHVKVFSKELCEYDDEQVRDNKQEQCMHSGRMSDPRRITCELLIRVVNIAHF